MEIHSLLWERQRDGMEDFIHTSIPPILLSISTQYGVWYPSKVNCAGRKEEANFVSAIETMSTFPLMAVCKSISLFLTELILR